MQAPASGLPGAVALAAALLYAPASAQVFADNTTDIPTDPVSNGSYTENVDFGDVDLDGDWDAVFADGGDAGNDQNRIWINLGGLQAGAIGTFDDQTVARFPAVADDSRDVELADIDGDGDLDLYTANTSDSSNQSNRWWINQGLAQAGTLGFFADDTAARWVGLGGAGSSIAPAAVLGGGGFVDWSCDCDFGDLDNDGDLDLVHSSYGSAFSGAVPTRLFLNDGSGQFSEFNPGGFQLPGITIANGQSALWAEGVQAHDTTDTAGTEADVALATLDVDLGDVDGDLDLDLLHGDRNNVTRFFHNRLEENGGTLGFRDVTHDVFPSGWALGGGKYEQEMGDVDGDGDLDLYGLNWEGFRDRMFRNGSGVFGDLTTLDSSNADDNEGDFLDFDNDGDLDLYVCNFSGDDKLYRNDDTGSGPVGMTFLDGATSGLAGTGERGLDADACDVDKDGDTDVFVARDKNSANLYLENLTDVPDVTPPALFRLEDLGDAAAALGARPVRVQVYDNTPYYITYANATTLAVTVDGHAIPPLPMRSSGGQIFRGEIPSNLVGTVAYTARSTDDQGNTGTSATESYVATGPPPATVFGTGTPGSLGVPTIGLLGLPLAGSKLYAYCGNVPSGTGVYMALSATGLVPPFVYIEGAIFNIAAPILAVVPLAADTNGDALLVLDLDPSFAGISVFFQGFALDGLGDDLFASTLGMRVDIF